MKAFKHMNSCRTWTFCSGIAFLTIIACIIIGGTIISAIKDGKTTANIEAKSKPPYTAEYIKGQLLYFIYVYKTNEQTNDYYLVHRFGGCLKSILDSFPDDTYTNNDKLIEEIAIYESKQKFNDIDFLTDFCFDLSDKYKEINKTQY